jgi:hypothetical protein
MLSVQEMNLLDSYLTLGDAQFEIRFVEGEHRFAREAFDILSEALPSITRYFLVYRPFPKARVVLVTPRWWSEGLAVYLSRQWRYEDEFRKAVIDGIAEKDIPGFRQIEVERKLAYDWGWTIVRFIESVYGRDMILRIVSVLYTGEECVDGKVFSVIGEEAGSLENRWMDWLLVEGRLTTPPVDSGCAAEDTHLVC